MQHTGVWTYGEMAGATDGKFQSTRGDRRSRGSLGKKAEPGKAGGREEVIRTPRGMLEGRGVVTAFWIKDKVSFLKSGMRWTQNL